MGFDFVSFSRSSASFLDSWPFLWAIRHQEAVMTVSAIWATTAVTFKGPPRPFGPWLASLSFLWHFWLKNNNSFGKMWNWRNNEHNSNNSTTALNDRISRIPF